MDSLAVSLSGIIGLGHTLVDRTGLIGRFDFTLAWAPEPTAAPAPLGSPTTTPDPLDPTPVQALRDQLGLKLESARGPVKILVIDRVERPSKNDRADFSANPARRGRCVGFRRLPASPHRQRHREAV